MSQRDDTFAFLDGVLTPEEAERYRDDLADSAELQQALHDAVQLEVLAGLVSEGREPIAAAAVVRRRNFARRWVGGGVISALAAAAVAAFIVGWPPLVDPGPRLELRLGGSEEPRRGVGDQLEAVVRPEMLGERAWALRIYHRGELVAACPGPACALADGIAAVDVTLEAGRYDVVLLVADSEIAAPTGSADGDVGQLPTSGDFEYESLVVR